MNDGEALPGPALLFCPADRPDRYAKALAAADGVILDLEDGVSADNKDTARAALASTLTRPGTGHRPGQPVRDRRARGGPRGTAAARDTGRIMLAKAETGAQLAELGGAWQVVALCETARGIVNAAEIAAAPNVIALMWGAEDLIASMRGRTSRHPDGRYRDVALHARSTVLLAAAAHGKPAIDSVYVDIPDLDGLTAESEDAAASGFALKACIHPSQAAVVRKAFQADEAQVAWARRVLAAVRDASAQDKGVIKVDGQMIDAPLIRQAEAILASLR